MPLSLGNGISTCMTKICFILTINLVKVREFAIYLCDWPCSGNSNINVAYYLLILSA